MIEIIVHPHDKALPAPRSGRVPVHLYGSVGRSGTAAIGGPVLHVLSRIATPIDPVAFDFLSLSLAVTAADTFANRQRLQMGGLGHPSEGCASGTR